VLCRHDRKVRLLDLAREEKRRQLAGEPPLPLPPGPSLGWLTRAGYAKRIRASTWTLVVAMVLLVFGLFRLREFGPWPFLLGVALLWLGSLLKSLIRCRVCGLNIQTSAAARRLPQRQRYPWLITLEACPVCGDDGRATVESRIRWRESGAAPESRYWSIRRLAVAVLLTVVFVGGGILVAELVGHQMLRP